MKESNPQEMPNWIEHTYERLAAHIDVPSRGLSRDVAYKVLMEDDEFENEYADAKYAVERLLRRGWLYEVDGELRITDLDGSSTADQDRLRRGDQH